MNNKTNRYIGKYQINALLGSGTMGRVYKVTIPVLGKTAALKLFKPSKALIKKAGLAWLKERFIQEASVIANIRHPNIAQIWNFEETEKNLYFLMEYYCRNLGKLMGETYWADRPSRIIPIDKACNYIIQILEGLSRLHEAKIIHRDIKPFNIMISDMGTIKIVDFGLSKRRGEKQSLSAKKLAIGTPFYTAPEQIFSPDEADGRADLFSVGVILFRMLIGILPGKKAPLVSTVLPQLNLGWDQFIQKALEPDPDDRFQNAQTMSDHLNVLYQSYKKNNGDDCSAPDRLLSDDISKNNSNTHQLRSESKRILAKHAKKTFTLNGLHQPEIYHNNSFKLEQKTMIKDQSTRLIWQQSGSRYPVQWEDAKHFIQRLNDTEFGGYSHWRLPTINELLSLLNPPSQDIFCLEPVFSDIQKCLWSGDTRSKKSAWTMDLEIGFITSCDCMDYSFVKGVCSV